MDDATFHPFTRLPCELREQIWQDAAYRQLFGRSGYIRYVKMDENRNLLPINYSRNTGDAEHKSGYTWDSYVGAQGIMAACRHSYDVANQFDEQCRRESVSIERWSYCKRVFVPETIGGCQAIDLRDDICCITSDSWESLLRPWKPIFLRTRDSRGRIRTEKSLNIGIRFDPAWNEELDKATWEVIDGVTHHTVLRQFSPRLAFVIRLLCQLAPKDDEFGPKLMLIDDVSKYKCLGGAHNGRGTRAFDADQGYVELFPKTDYTPVKHSPMYDFVDDLEYLYRDKRIRASRTGRVPWLLDNSSVFSPLLRRENLVPGSPGGD